MLSTNEFNPPLGHPEHHFNKYPNHPWLKTKEKMIEWLEKHVRNYNFDSYEIHEDLTVSVFSEEFYIDNKNKYFFKVKNLKVKFRNVNRLYISCPLENLIGFPDNAELIRLNGGVIEDFTGVGNASMLIIRSNGLKNFIGLEKVNVKSLEVLIENEFPSWEGLNVNSLSVILINENPIKLDWLLESPNIKDLEIGRFAINGFLRLDNEQMENDVKYKIVDTSLSVDNDWLKNKKTERGIVVVNSMIENLVEENINVTVKKRKI